MSASIQDVVVSPPAVGRRNGARRPTIEWQVCGHCNYDCSYCIQSRKFRQGHPGDDEIEGFLSFFYALPGTWEIKMSGGEPFSFRGFMDRIVPGLAETRHDVSVLTNFSAPLPVLSRFVQLVGHKLKVFSASLHLEYVQAEEFARKAAEFKSWLSPETAFVINNVLVPGTVRGLEAVRETITRAGLKYFPQVMKTKMGTFDYAEEERVAVRRLVGISPSPRDANLAPSYRGRRCWTGVEYFTLSQWGDAYSCRTAKRYGEGYMGNVLDGTFSLRAEPRRCPYDICPCTVPANRGMIEGVGQAGKEAE
ncbi:MAG: radical SAM protein [Acidobacteriota bacterium]|nr:radical SAM protein [Acidobacteriota bacterium]